MRSEKIIILMIVIGKIEYMILASKTFQHLLLDANMGGLICRNRPFFILLSFSFSFSFPFPLTDRSSDSLRADLGWELDRQEWTSICFFDYGNILDGHGKCHLMIWYFRWLGEWREGRKGGKKERKEEGERERDADVLKWNEMKENEMK